MQYEQRISEIERRADIVNVSLPALCKSAAVPISTLWRWQHRAVSPKVSTLESHLAKLEGELAEIERRVVKSIAARSAA
jgi:hypothetical protein